MGCLSGPWIKPLPSRCLRDSKQSWTRAVIIGTGGIASMEDAVEMMMCGADVIGVCTETMLSGFSFLGNWMRSLKAYMNKMGFRLTGISGTSSCRKSNPLQN